MADGLQQPPAARTSQLVLDLMDHVSTNTAIETTTRCPHAPTGCACEPCIKLMIRRVIAASNDIPLPE